MHAANAHNEECIYACVGTIQATTSFHTPHRSRSQQAWTVVNTRPVVHPLCVQDTYSINFQ